MIDFLFSQYKGYPTHQIVLEIIAILFGLASVLFAKKNNILVYPTGIVSTIIFVYLLYKWSLIGDMLINGYYAIMSIYGWVLWSQKKDDIIEYPISIMDKRDIIKAVVIFFITVLFVVFIYKFFNKFTDWTAYVDTFTTGIFFVGMWLMAKRKIENWILWIIGDIISIPLYFYKGYTFTSLQYFIFTIIAIYAFKEWKKSLAKTI
ncbi:nicotinamide mononucleotide transporter [Flavobacterium sp. 316]|uniref:nicotinamide riboside transporter PnuC n=1 Tax=Flavobacterium sp. 316 TaxID=1603293 RepID=UPI0005E5684C|nr:nicotinamide riboside transporter PnuC [Flavobacterium sp. 316]KIX21763.1 nicotinamide mononucleotide transporter [Flavobacterium sp. 316]